MQFCTCDVGYLVMRRASASFYLSTCRSWSEDSERLPPVAPVISGRVSFFTGCINELSCVQKAQPFP